MKIYIDSGSGYVERTDLFLRGRVKFDRAEGEIGHTEAVIDFQDNFTASRGDKVKIEKGTKNIYLTVEKMVTNERKNRRVVAKDKIYFIKDKPLPAAVFVDVNLSDIMNWVKTQGGFDSYTVTPSGTADPAIAFFYVEEDTKIGELLGEIAEAIQGSVFAAVTDVSSEGNSIRFNAACLKTFNNTELMTLTADQLGSDEISDLPRQHNQFTLKFKDKKQIPDTLVFRGASYDDTFEVPADGYPEDSADSYYAEFENPVISVTSHSFDGYNCYIDQTVWRSNFSTSGVNYGDLSDPFKFKLKFGSDGSYGGTIYDFRIYGNAIKEDNITETLDISGSDYAKIKDYESELVTSHSDWHKKFIAWVTSKSYEKRSITVVDPDVDFVGLMTLMYGLGANKDNRVIKIDGVKMTVESATYDMAKNKWQLEGFKTRTSTTYSGYIEKQQDSNVLDKTQRKLVMAFDVSHPPEGNANATNQLVTFEPEIGNYDTEIITVYSGNIPSGQVGHIYISDKSNGSFVLNSFTRAAPQIYDHDPDYFLGQPAESGYFLGWNNIISYADDIYVTPANTDPTSEANSTGQTIGDMKLLIRYGGTNYLNSHVFNISSKASTETVYVVFYWTHQAGLTQQYRYHIDIYDGFTKIFNVERTVGRGYGGLLSLYLAYIEGESSTDNPLEAKYRIKLYQDINLRKPDGISTGLVSPRTALPTTYTIGSSALTDPPYTQTYSLMSTEEWTKAYTRDSSGNILDEKIIAVTGSTMDLIWYRKDPDDGKIYLDYDYNGSRRRVIFNGDSVNDAQMKEKIL